MEAVLTINSGSSTIKFATFELGGEAVERSIKGKIDRIGTAPVLSAQSASGRALDTGGWRRAASMTHEELLADLFEWGADHGLEPRALSGIGHRIVHGGPRFQAPILIDPRTIDELEALCPLAPLHQPHNVAGVKALVKLAPLVPQIACFDTAFHHSMSAVATRIALPRQFHDRGIRRYGFHGLSYEFVARRIAEIDPVLANGRVIAAHLGNGASLCAMKGGRSVDTTMAFTPLDGLVMGTRCGSIDPGVLLYLQHQMGMGPAAIEDLLYRKSGLMGVSGISSDMRDLEASTAAEAAEAINLFCWRAAREIGGQIVSLGGVDAIIFTAGIGENDAATRRRICDLLTWVGVVLDERANRENALRVSAEGSGVAVLVVPTCEEKMIALHLLEVLHAHGSRVPSNGEAALP